MIGVKASIPPGPRLMIVNVLPCSSARARAPGPHPLGQRPPPGRQLGQAGRVGVAGSSNDRLRNIRRYISAGV